MSSENLERAFEVFDRDHSGTISCAELKKILEGGLISDDEVWKGIVSSFDTNFDGEIDIHEFKKILLKQVLIKFCQIHMKNIIMRICLMLSLKSSNKVQLSM